MQAKLFPLTKKVVFDFLFSKILAMSAEPVEGEGPSSNDREKVLALVQEVMGESAVVRERRVKERRVE